MNILAPGSTGWNAGDPINKERVAPGAGSIADGRIALFGGQNGGQAIEETYLYDPIYGDHQDGANMATPRAHGAYATDANTGFIYAVGGIDDNLSVLGTTEVYDPWTDTWTTVSPIPSARADFPAASDGAGTVFTFGGRRAGWGANDVTNSVFAYDIGSDTWNTRAPMPAALRDSVAVAGPNDGKIYVIGGRDATGPVASVYVYDYVNDTWEIETSLPAAISDATAVLDTDGRLMLLGGRDSLGQAISTVHVTQDLDAENLAPTFVSSPPIVATSTLPYSYQVVATGNPQAQYELLAAPTGMTLDAAGLIQWTPDESQVGTQEVTVRSFNLAGTATQSYSVTVTSAIPAITSNPLTSASTGVSYSYDVNATGTPAPTFAMIDSPAGMTINASTGVVSWTPTVAQAGQYAVTVAASNSRGSDTQSFTIGVADRTAPTAPTTLAVSGLAETSVTLSWNASTDNVGVVKYQVYEQYKYGWRNSLTGYRLKQDNVSGTSTTVSGLTANTSYKLVVRAVDGAGNLSASSNLVTTKTYTAPTLATSSLLTATANHAYTLQLTSVANPVPVFSIVSGPAGMTINATTGLVSWIPGTSNIGTVPAIFRTTNVVGTRDLPVNITVNSDAPVLSATLSTGTVLVGQPMTIQVRDASATPST